MVKKTVMWFIPLVYQEKLPRTSRKYQSARWQRKMQHTHIAAKH